MPGLRFSVLGLLLLTASTPAASHPWLYQLQDPAPAAIRTAGFRTCVIDYSRDGTDRGRLTAGPVRALRRAGITALAYLSIGEAEDYRFYWRQSWATAAGAPAWLGRPNPDWPGNRKVRY